MDKALFFDRVRQSLYGGRMKELQVSGIEAVLAAWEGAPTRFTSYGLATAFAEVGADMQPVREGFKKTDAQARALVKKLYWTMKSGKPGYGRPAGPHGHVYYGRGYVQLTWLANYERASTVLGVDCVRDPDLVLEPTYAARIMRDGMERGWFTGKKLADYLAGDRTDYKGARRIINGQDRAAEIAGYALAFEAALRAAGYGKEASVKPAPAPLPPPPDIPAPEPAPSPPEREVPFWKRSPILRSVGQGVAWLGAGGSALLAADWRVIAVLSVVGLALAVLALRYQVRAR